MRRQFFISKNSNNLNLSRKIGGPKNNNKRWNQTNLQKNDWPLWNSSQSLAAFSSQTIIGEKEFLHLLLIAKLFKVMKKTVWCTKPPSFLMKVLLLQTFLTLAFTAVSFAKEAEGQGILDQKISFKIKNESF